MTSTAAQSWTNSCYAESTLWPAQQLTHGGLWGALLQAGTLQLGSFKHAWPLSCVHALIEHADASAITESHLQLFQSLAQDGSHPPDQGDPYCNKP
jgi:hypothetical protein